MKRAIGVKRRHPNQKHDFAVSNHGSIFLLKPITNAAIKWVERCIGADNGYQPYYPAAVILEPRFMDEVITSIRKLGLVAR
jgi:carotenoid cleavage dioxygenase-like enzyme